MANNIKANNNHSDWEVVSDQPTKSDYSDWEVINQPSQPITQPTSNVGMNDKRLSPSVLENFNKYMKYQSERNPLLNLRDFAAGALESGQRAATTLGEAGQAIGQLANPIRKYIPEWMKVVPNVNIAEEMGMGKERPINPLQLIGSKDPNAFAYGMGREIPGLLMGGLSIPGQIASNALWGGIQARPGEEYGFGQLPRGKIGAAIEGGLLGSIPLVGKLGKGAIKSAVNLPKAFSKLNPEEIKTSLQSSHDILENESKNLFTNVGQHVKKRNISPIPIENKLIDDISEHFPKSTANKDLIERARTGNYEALRKLQTDMWKRGKRNINSGTEADRNRGELLLDLRNTLNESIANHFEKTGHSDLSKMLKNAMKKYATLKDIYYNKDLPLSIRKLVDPDIREMPKNLMEIISTESIPMEKVRKHTSPYVSKQVRLKEQKEKAKADLWRLGKIAGLGTSTIAGGAYLAKNIFGNK